MRVPFAGREVAVERGGKPLGAGLTPDPTRRSRVPERPAVEVPGRVCQARAGRIGARVPGVGVAERLPPRMVGRTSMMAVLEVATGPYDGVVCQFGIAASAQSPSTW